MLYTGKISSPKSNVKNFSHKKYALDSFQKKNILHEFYILVQLEMVNNKRLKVCGRDVCVVKDGRWQEISYSVCMVLHVCIESYMYKWFTTWEMVTVHQWIPYHKHCRITWSQNLNNSVIMIVHYYMWLTQNSTNL